MKTYHRVRMFDTDCANVIFFGSQFRFFHEAIEVLFDNLGFPFSAMFSADSPFLFVVVHASSDFIKPLSIGDPLEIETKLKNLGNSSWTLTFDLLRNGELVGQGEIIQVCLDAKTRTKTPIPNTFRQKVTQYLT